MPFYRTYLIYTHTLSHPEHPSPFLTYSLSLACSEDFALLVSASHDNTLKTWRTTPRHPDPPAAPRILAVTDTTGMILLVYLAACGLCLISFLAPFRTNLSLIKSTLSSNFAFFSSPPLYSPAELGISSVLQPGRDGLPHPVAGGRRQGPLGAPRGSLRAAAFPLQGRLVGGRV